MVADWGLREFHPAICQLAWEFAAALVHGALTLEVCLMGQEGEILGQYPHPELPKGNRIRNCP